VFAVIERAYVHPLYLSGARVHHRAHPPEMAAPARLALGQTHTGWGHLMPRLQEFGRACEAIVHGSIVFELTDDSYIGKACFRLLGDVRQLDARVFALWVGACPWECTFVPSHDGYPCLFVTPFAPPRHTGLATHAKLAAKVLLVMSCSIAASWWVDAQTPPAWVPEALHEWIAHPGRVALFWV
jgi:hypothetical protein